MQWLVGAILNWVSKIIYASLCDWLAKTWPIISTNQRNFKPMEAWLLLFSRPSGSLLVAAPALFLFWVLIRSSSYIPLFWLAVGKFGRGFQSINRKALYDLTWCKLTWTCTVVARAKLHSLTFTKCPTIGWRWISTITCPPRCSWATCFGAGSPWTPVRPLTINYEKKKQWRVLADFRDKSLTFLRDICVDVYKRFSAGEKWLARLEHFYHFLS